MPELSEVTPEASSEPKEQITWPPLLVMLLCPLLAIAFAGWSVYHVLDAAWDLPGWLNLLIAAVAAVIAVAASIGAQGNDGMDVIVGSIIVIVFVFILHPVGMRGAEQGARRRQEERLRKAPVVQPAPAQQGR